jgi:hypothetical protein
VASTAYFNVTVGTTAVQLTGQYGGAIGIFNNGAAAIFLGFDANVTTANGFPVPAGSGFSINSEANQNTLWAISGTAGQDVRVILGAK